MVNATNIPSPTRKLSTRKRIAFSALLFLIVVLVLELLLHGLCAFTPRVARLLEPESSFADESREVDDEILGHRPRPGYGDHDRRGFRNRVALDKAEIVCLGDSQTYGSGVTSDEVWPQQLSLMSRKSVYNMACPGWGPTHSEALLDEALALHPQLVLEGFYSGNDLWDCYSMVLRRQTGPGPMTVDLDLRAKIEEAEEKESLKEKVSKLIRVYNGDFGSDEAGASTAANRPNVPTPWAVRRLLSDHSRLYGVGRAIKMRILQSDEKRVADAEWERLRVKAAASGQRWEVFESNHIRTIFVPEYRLAALQMDDPRIQAGHQWATEALVAIDRRLAQEAVPFLVVLIPTKELVFYPEVDAPSSKLSEIVNNEVGMWAETKNLLEAEGVLHVDTLPALRDALKNGIQTYPISADGHPNAHGQRVIADVVMRWICENHRLRSAQ